MQLQTVKTDTHSCHIINVKQTAKCQKERKNGTRKNHKNNDKEYPKTGIRNSYYQRIYCGWRRTQIKTNRNRGTKAYLQTHSFKIRRARQLGTAKNKYFSVFYKRCLCDSWMPTYRLHPSQDIFTTTQYSWHAMRYDTMIDKIKQLFYGTIRYENIWAFLRLWIWFFKISCT